MPEAFSTPNLVALPITSQELGRGGFFAPPTKIVISNSPTTIGLIDVRMLMINTKFRMYYKITTSRMSVNIKKRG